MEQTSILSSLLILFALSAKLYDIYHYCVYSETLLIMYRGIVRNKNKFEKLVHLADFIIRYLTGCMVT